MNWTLQVGRTILSFSSIITVSIFSNSIFYLSLMSRSCVTVLITKEIKKPTGVKYEVASRVSIAVCDNQCHR